MGSLGTFFAATLVAVNYGWVPASAENQEMPTAEAAGYEYLVQVGSEDMRALAEGRVSSLSSATPEGMKSIDRVRIVFGEGQLPRQLTAVDRTSPQRIAAQSQTAQQHTVAKPVVSDWLPARKEPVPNETAEKQEGVRHTVYQRPGYQNPGSLGDAMQRGFQAGSRQVTDAIRNAPQNMGNYANQTGRDLADGTRGVVGGALGGLRNSVEAGANGLGNVANNGLNFGNNQYSNQRQQERNAAAQPNRTGTNTGTNQPGFRAFSYNEPQLAAQANSRTQAPQLAQTSGQANNQDSHAGHDHSGHDHAGHNHPQSTTPDPQTVQNRNNQGPAFPSATGRNRADDGIATTFGSGAASDRGYDNQNYNNRGQYADPYDDTRRLTPVARNDQEPRRSQNDSFYGQDSTRRGPLNEFGTRREEPRRTEYDDWRTQTVENRPAAPAFGTPTNTWENTPANPQPSVAQTAGFGTQGQNQQGASNGVRSWNDGAANPQQNNGPYGPQNGPSQNGMNTNNNGGLQNAPLSNPTNNLLVSLLLAGSLAGNLYIVTSYLDVRNKYRSALRRGPGSYQNAA